MYRKISNYIKEYLTGNQISTQGLTTSQKKVLEAIKNNPTASIHELSQILELGTTRISVVIKELKALNRLERIGKTKGGYWQVR